MNKLVGMSQDVKLFKATQKLRTGLRERIRASEQGRSNGDVVRYGEWLKEFEKIEKTLQRHVELGSKRHPLWYEWLCNVRGVGKSTLAQLMGEIVTVNMIWNQKNKEQKPEGIAAFNTVSALWRYAGIGLGKYWQNEKGDIVAPKKGHKMVGKEGEKERVLFEPEPKEGWELVEVRDRPLEGWCLPYNKRLKTVCLEFVGGGIIRANGKYRAIYDEQKAYYEMDRPDWPQMRRHYAARRKMVKVFMSHFWEQWRVFEGLPTRLPYVIEKLGHTHIYDWREFVERPEDILRDKIEADSLMDLEEVEAVVV